MKAAFHKGRQLETARHATNKREAQMRKIISLLLVCITILTISGCSSSSIGQTDYSSERERIETISDANAEADSAKDYQVQIFSPEKLAGANISNVFPAPEGFYVIVSEIEYSGGAAIPRNAVYLSDADGNILKEMDTGGISGIFCVSPSLELWTIQSTETDNRTALIYDVWQLSGSGIRKALELRSDASSYYEFAVSDKVIYVQKSCFDPEEYRLETYNTEGDLLSSVELPSEMQLYPTGTCLYLIDTGSETLYTLDEQTSSLQELWKGEENANYSFIQVYEDIIYLKDGDWCSALYPADGEIKQLFRWDSYGILRCDSLYRLTENRLLIYSLLNATSPFRLLVPREGSGKPRQEIVFAMNDPDIYGMASVYGMYVDAIQDFNDTNSDYYITVKNYADCSDPQMLLNADIASQKGPDLVEMTHFSAELVSNEKCQDIMAYLEKDESLSPDKLLSAPLELMKSDGHLLSIMPSFYIITLVCATQELQGTEIGSYCDLLALGTGQKSLLGMSCSKQQLLNYAFTQNRRNFSAEEISALLQLASTLPEDAERGRSDILNGERIFEIAKISYPLVSNASVQDLTGVAEERLYFGPNISMPGLPVAGDCCPVITPAQELIIPESADNKEGAWEFIKFVLSARYQLSYGSYKNGIPLSKSAFDAGLTGAEDWIETYGGKVQANFGGSDYVITDDRDSRQFSELINSVGAILRGEDEIYHMAYSIANEYFSGNKSLSQASMDIASRLKIYFEENK